MSAGTLLYVPVWRADDASGKAVPGALAYFYRTLTVVPQAVYLDAGFLTPTLDPVVADSGGLFPPIYMDPTETYRLILTTSTGALIRDVDPVSAPLSIPDGFVTSAMLAAGASLASLGFNPVNKAGDTATNLRLAFSGARFADSAGYMGLPPATQNANYTFAAGDFGKRIRHTDGASYAWTIPANASVPLPVGAWIAGRNFGAGVITLTRDAGVSLRLIGAATDTNLAAAQWATWVIEKEDTDVWFASGTGLS